MNEPSVTFSTSTPHTVSASSSSSHSLRKAASAADFTSLHRSNRLPTRFSSRGRYDIGERNLGVLTPFLFSSPQPGSIVNHGGHGRVLEEENENDVEAQTQGWPPSANGSQHGSSSSLTGLRSSHSNARLSALPSGMHHGWSMSDMGSSWGSTVSASGGGGAVGNGSVPPLVAHFSLASVTKYDGRARTRRNEIAMVTEKLREMQYEVSRLNRKIREYEEDTEQWSLRYSRRLVLLSNIACGCWIFLLRFLGGVRARRISPAITNRLFIPQSVLASAAAAAAAAANGSNSAKAASSLSSHAATPLSAVLISAILRGAQSSLFFFMSAVLQTRPQAWKRNAGFLLSATYSLYLILGRSSQIRPAAANWINIAINIAYLAARYYYLHGLLVFNSMRIL